MITATDETTAKNLEGKNTKYPAILRYEKYYSRRGYKV